MSAQSIELKHPITVDGEEITELKLRRPKLRDLKRAAKCASEMDKATALLCDLAEITPKAADEIDAEDFARVSEVVGNFFGASAD